jgi:hypothetical protein
MMKTRKTLKSFNLLDITNTKQQRSCGLIGTGDTWHNISDKVLEKYIGTTKTSAKTVLKLTICGITW